LRQNDAYEWVLLLGPFLGVPHDVRMLRRANQCPSYLGIGLYRMLALPYLESEPYIVYNQSVWSEAVLNCPSACGPGRSNGA
jgi:hypothetical protein